MTNGVEPFEYNIWEHVDTGERIDWTEDDEELEDGE